MPKAQQPAPIHIFRPGRHTAMQGQSLDFSEADLAATAAAYNPALHEAPLVIGHPEADAPAYGWVAGLTADPGGLFAAPRQLEPAFAEEVRSGRYKKVSASFYAPDSPHNPKPGVYYLRHVGFLGAQPPAVKGLAPVQFAEGDTEEGCVTVEFAESPGLLRRLADLFRSIREYIVEKDGAEAADRVVSPWAVSDLQEQAAQAAAQAADMPAYMEPEKKEKDMPKPNTAPLASGAEELKSLADDPAFAKAQARAQELEKQVAALAADARRARARAVVDSAVAEGRLTPAQSVGLADFMAGLEEEQTFEFAEGDKTVSVTPSAFMAAFLPRLAKQVDFAEVSKDSHDSMDGLTPQEAARQVLCYQEEMRQKGVVVSITDAMGAVKAGAAKAKE